MTTRRNFARVMLVGLAALCIAPTVSAQQGRGGGAGRAGAAAAQPLAPTGPAQSILFVGNSFTYGASSPVWRYRADTVTDLNNSGIGGVPALFKAFADQQGLNYNVSLETNPGVGLDFHLANRRPLLDKPWDIVVMHGLSTLDGANPGNPGLLVRTAAEAAQMFQAKNPNVQIHITATWSRADLTYPANQTWSGKPITQMAVDVRSAYDQAAAASPYIRTVIPVGEAWNRAFAANVADPNPYDGIAANQVNLWTYDHYHASAYGYYLHALMVYGRITGRDPTTLGGRERSAQELGFSAAQTTALQQIARDELAAYRGKGAA